MGSEGDRREGVRQNVMEGFEWKSHSAAVIEGVRK